MKSLRRRIVCRPWVTVLVAAVLLLWAAPVQCAETSGKVVRIGWYKVDGLNDVDASGNPSGFDYDYLKAIAQYTGWQYEFVNASWKDCLSMLENGQIDLLGGVAKTDEREQTLDFSRLSQGVGGSRIICRTDDDRFANYDYESLRGKTVGEVKESALNTSFDEMMEEKGISYTPVEFDNQQTIMDALKDKKVDALLISQTRAVEGYRTVLLFNSEQFYFATTKGNEEVMGRVDEAMNNIAATNPDFSSRLFDRYFHNTVSGAPIFTEDEQAYLKTHPTVTVAFDPAWRPIEYRDAGSGKFSGVMAQVFDKISAMTGIQFQYVADDSYAETLNNSGKKADIISTVGYGYQWGDQLGVNLTQPIIEAKIDELYRNDIDVGKVKQVAVAKEYFLTGMVKEHFSDKGWTYKECDTEKDCVDAVYNGQADAVFLTNYELAYYLSNPRYNAHLLFQSVNDFDQMYSTGISKKADARLFTIISKAVGSISAKDMSEIISKETTVQKPETILDMAYTNPGLVLGLSLGIAALIFFVIFFSSRSSIITRKNKELAEANAALKSANEAKTVFMSQMSHDMRTPLNGILGLAHLGASGCDDPAGQRDFKKIEASGHYLLGMINDILDLDQINQGKITLNNEPMTMAAYTASVRESIDPLLKAKNLTLHIDDSGVGCPYFSGDILQLKRILMNLLGNAVKFSEPGSSIDWIIQTKDLEEENRFELTQVVMDHGRGMSERFLEKVFDPFEQENAQTDDRRNGSGLGLTICKRLTERMGGTIGVQSKIGEGTSFTVRIPFSREDEPDEGKNPQNGGRKKWNLAGKNILLAEDHPLNAEIGRRMLEGEGMQVVHAVNGQEAVDRFKMGPIGEFDTILMDIRMPVMDGITASRTIRGLERPDAGTVPIIAMTANAYSEDIARCMEAGMNAHLAKPVDQELLFQTLKNQMEAKTNKADIEE